MAFTQANILNEVLHAYKVTIDMSKTSSLTTAAGQPSALIDRPGYPAAGSLNPGNTTTGIVPTDATAGFPAIENFQAGLNGYLSRVEVNSSVPCSIAIYDVLFMAGQTTIPTSGTTTVTLSSQPDFSGRVPFQGDGTTRDWSRVSLFLQSSVAWSNHAHSTSVTYTDQGGASGSTGNVSTQNYAVSRWQRCPLAAGDSGVQRIDSYAVNGIASATGAVSVICARKLFSARCNLSAIYGPDQTGLQRVYQDSALLLVAITDGTASGLPSVTIDIAQG